MDLRVRVRAHDVGLHDGPISSGLETQLHGVIRPSVVGLGLGLFKVRVRDIQSD